VASPKSPVISPEIAEFLAGGLIMFLGSRAADLSPECVIATGVRVEARGSRFSVFLPERFASETVANLRENGEAALTVSRVVDDRSIQIKGTYVSHRAGDERDRELLQTLVDRRTAQMAEIGMPRSIAVRLTWWPCVVVLLRAREIFVQTPGPRAGQPLTSPGDLA
jgi:hypothetical protein